MEQSETLEQKCAKSKGASARLGLNYHRGCPLKGNCEYKSEHAYTIVMGSMLPCCKARYSTKTEKVTK